jgi:hypothetical protein
MILGRQGCKEVSMIWILYLSVFFIIFIFASILFSCLCVARRSDEQIERQQILPGREINGALYLPQQDSEHLFSTQR